MPRKHLWVYIAGPMTKPDLVANTANGVAVYNRLLNLNATNAAAKNGMPLVVPICPHLSTFAHLFVPRGHAEWLEHDKALLMKCDAVYRIPGASKGADLEEQFCKDELGIPWFTGYGELLLWIERFAE